MSRIVYFLFETVRDNFEHYLIDRKLNTNIAIQCIAI